MFDQVNWSVKKGLFLRKIRHHAPVDIPATENVLARSSDADRFERMPVMDTLPDNLKHVWGNLMSASDYNDVYDAMDKAVKDIPGFKQDQKDPLTYYYQNYRITQGLSMHLDHEVHNVNYANTLGLSAAPSFILAAKLMTGHTFMLTQGDQALVPFFQNRDLVHNNAKQKFLDDMKTLAEAGYVHSYGVKGAAHWFVKPDTGEIILNQWSSLRPLEAGETPESIQKRFKKTLSAD